MTLILDNFPLTADEFTELVLRFYPNPSPWTNPQSQLHFEKEIARGFFNLRHFCLNALTRPFCQELARIAKFILARDLDNTRPCAFDATFAVLARANLHPPHNPPMASYLSDRFYFHLRQSGSADSLVALLMTNWN